MIYNMLVQRRGRANINQIFGQRIVFAWLLNWTHDKLIQYS